MTPEVFIDLDDREDWRDEVKPVALQRNRSYRTIALAAVVAMLIGLPTMSIRPRPPIVQVGIFSQPQSESLMLVGDATVSRHGGLITVSNVDGTVRWTHRLAGPFNYVQIDIDPVSGVFLARVMRMDAGDDGPQRLTTSEVIGLDTATGQVRWRVDGGLVRRGDVLLGTEDHWIRVYQANPPAIRWEASGFVKTALDRSEYGRVWGLKADGTLSEMDVRTGAVRDWGKLPPAVVSRATAKGGYLFVLGGLLVIQSRTVEVYDLATLQPRSWESPWLPEYE